MDSFEEPENMQYKSKWLALSKVFECKESSGNVSLASIASNFEWNV
jgi:hypothetical protein